MMSALSAFTSQNICAGENERTVSIVKYCIMMTFVFGIMCCILSQFIYKPIASFFSQIQQLFIQQGSSIFSLAICEC